jgi:hypothetical protein
MSRTNPVSSAPYFFAFPYFLDSTSTFSIPYPASGPDIKSFILGSETEFRIVLQGYDELGRPVTIPVSKF